MLTEVTDENFKEEVLESDIPVLVDFYAEWCGPCRDVAEALKTISEEQKGKVKICKGNIDNNGTTLGEYKVTGIPATLTFKAGEMISSNVGIRTRKDLIKDIKEICDGE